MIYFIISVVVALILGGGAYLLSSLFTKNQIVKQWVFTGVGLVTLISTCTNNSSNESRDIPSCHELSSEGGLEIAKSYLKGSWVDEYDDRIWGMIRFTYDGNNTLHLWEKEPKATRWVDKGTFELLEVKEYTHTTIYGCREFLFHFYNGSGTVPIYVESKRGACQSRADGRDKFVRFE